MDINAAHCFFEQSGTFKNEFKKLGINSFDYDIQNKFKQTDYVVDLFLEIDKAYNNQRSVFDFIGCNDLIIAFFPCIHFCDAKTMIFKGVSIFQKSWSLEKIMKKNIELSKERQFFYETLLKFVCVAARKKIPLVIENPWNDSGETYLQRNFLQPTIIDKNRNARGDYFVKPTAYWFFNCKPTFGYSFQQIYKPKIVYKEKDSYFAKAGVCSAARSMISPEYAHNFICDFLIGKAQPHTQPSLFNDYDNQNYQYEGTK